jgi:hypothetical protein
MKKYVYFAVILLTASTMGAQGPAEKANPVNSLRGALGHEYLPDSMFKRGDGTFKCKPPGDGKAYAGRTAGVVIYSSNTSGCDDLFCTQVDEDFLYLEPDFWVLSGVPQSLIFQPSPKRSKFLEIIWSGQINISSGTAGGIDQQVFLRCTVTQGGVSVPCSNTCMDPSIAQAVTDDGLTAWVTYHGFVEMNPKKEVMVEIRLFASQATSARVCEDTMILKY